MVEEVLSLSGWVTPEGTISTSLDGDDWSPGEGFVLLRSVDLLVEPHELVRRLGLPPDATIGIAGRWTCRSTFASGTHRGGPQPLPLSDDTRLQLDMPSDLADSLTLETCLIVTRSAPTATDSVPDGGLVWSDGWIPSKIQRTVTLEGSEARIPVHAIDFSSHFVDTPSTFWAIDLDSPLALDDRLANSVAILLNSTTIDRDFKGADGKGDSSLIPESIISSISVDLIRLLTDVLQEELAEAGEWNDHAEGSVGSMLILRLTEAFGSIDRALAHHAQEPATFDRVLWDRFAPDRWMRS